MDCTVGIGHDDTHPWEVLLGALLYAITVGIIIEMSYNASWYIESIVLFDIGACHDSYIGWVGSFSLNASCWQCRSVDIDRGCSCTKSCSSIVSIYACGDSMDGTVGIGNNHSHPWEVLLGALLHAITVGIIIKMSYNASCDWCGWSRCSIIG